MPINPEPGSPTPWVVLQFTLLGCVLAAAVFLGYAQRPTFCVQLGGALMLISGVTALAGALALGRALTPSPHPRDKTELVTRGVYRLIRHPLYTSLALLTLGLSIFFVSLPAFVLTLAFLRFLYLKTRHEEHLLHARFPEYADYSRRVKRYIPWLF